MIAHNLLIVILFYAVNFGAQATETVFRVNQTISIGVDLVQISIKIEGFDWFRVVARDFHRSNHFLALTKASVSGRPDSLVNGLVDIEKSRFQGVVHFNVTTVFYIEPTRASFRPDSAKFSCFFTGHQTSFAARNQRFSRQVLRRIPFPGDRSTCDLFLATDLELFKIVFESDGDRNEQKTLDYISATLRVLVEELNVIYENVEFRTSRGGVYKGLNFRIKAQKITTIADCANRSSPKDRLSVCQHDQSILRILRDWQTRDFSDYCLAYLISATNFARDAGVAVMGDPGRGEGACGSVVQGDMSLNTGVVILFSYVEAAGRKRGTIGHFEMSKILAHEIGHSFGAPHDPLNGVCGGGGGGFDVGGGYIMYYSLEPGYLANNLRFSQCSLRDMSEFIEDLVESDRNCLVRVSGQKCDCGNENGGCCYPANYTDQRKRCRLRENAICDRSQGKCCDGKTCGFAEAGVICDSAEDDCRISSKCSGFSAKCKSMQSFSDGTLCGNDSGTCLDGRCRGSICTHFGLEQCEPTKKSKNDLCRVHCLVKGKCLSTFEFEQNMLHCRNIGFDCGKGFLKKNGSPCGGGADGSGVCRNGICDSVNFLNAGKPKTRTKAKRIIFWLLIGLFVVFVLIVGGSFCWKRKLGGGISFPSYSKINTPNQ